MQGLHCSQIKSLPILAMPSIGTSGVPTGYFMRHFTLFEITSDWAESGKTKEVVMLQKLQENKDIAF